MEEGQVKPETLPYDKNLWNRYRPLHKRYKRKCECFENVLEIFTRILASLKDNKKVISTLISKNFLLFPEQNFTQAIALNSIKKLLDFEFAQLNLNIEVLKKNLIDQFKKHKDEYRQIEKDAKVQFMKILTKYNDSKLLMEKNKVKYHQSIKLAESSLRTAKTMKIKNVNNSQDSQLTIQKLEDKAKELLIDAKKNYDKYVINVKDANKNREESIQTQIKILKLYQYFETMDGEIITNLLNDLYKRLKEENEAKNVILNEIEQNIKNIDVIKDKNNIVKLYKSEEKPDEVLNLVQYEPSIDFEKAKNPDEYKINHEIIVTIKSFIPDIMPNFNIEEENQKQEMR